MRSIAKEYFVGVEAGPLGAKARGQVPANSRRHDRDQYKIDPRGDLEGGRRYSAIGPGRNGRQAETDAERNKRQAYRRRGYRPGCNAPPGNGRQSVSRTYVCGADA